MTPEQIALTAASIASMQEPDGAIPWTTGEHTDAWNHVEAAMALLVAGEVDAAEAAYSWCERNQRLDGSWPMKTVAGEVEGGHVRIYTGDELVARLERAGLVYDGKDHAHGLHAPYWWLKCAVGVDNDKNPLVKAYHQVLVWDIMGTPRWSTLTRAAERVLNPLIGKSMVLYLRKPETSAP